MIVQLTTSEIVEKVKDLMISYGYSETTIGRYLLLVFFYLLRKRK